MRIFRILIFTGVISLVGLGNAFAQIYDISSGGLPTLTGSQGGSVVGSASTLSNLTVTINWGELSPSNTNGIIKATVPIAIRSLASYQISVSVTGGTSVNPQGVQRSDVGFGLLRSFTYMGANSRTCSPPDTFNPAITADPTIGVALDGAGRRTYVSSMNTISGSTVILSGPTLSFVGGRRTDNGWIINVIFAMTPQFYANGTTSTVVTFTIGAGPVLVC